MGERLARLTLAVSLAALVLLAGLWAWNSRPRADAAGALERLGGRQGDVESALALLPPAGADRPDPVAARPAGLAALPAPGPAPVRLSIPDIGVDAPVAPVGLSPGGGEMDLPPDRWTVGWYRYGPSPGEPGSALLAGHVDLEPDLTGVFFRLRSLEPGARLRVRYADGSERWFEVVARRTYPRDGLPAELLYARDGSPVLALVTCAGDFDRASNQYRANTVVFAVPLP